MRFAFVLFALACVPAAAHIRMDFPIGRYGDDFQKQGPCGAGADDPRSGNINTFEPGATVTVRWSETIDHVGFFRVAFDVDGSDDFEDPANELARTDDGINGAGLERTLEIVLPDTECDNCTVQLIQDMSGGFYYQCADLVIKAGAGNDDDADKAAPNGCSGAGAGLPIALLAVLARRSKKARASSALIPGRAGVHGGARRAR